MNPNDLDLLVRLVNINYFTLYNPNQSLQYIKQCIKNDPENKVCKNLKRKIKQFEDKVSKVSNDIEGQRFLASVKKLIGTKESKGLINEANEELITLSEGNKKSELLMKLYAWACKAYAEVIIFLLYTYLHMFFKIFKIFYLILYLSFFFILYI